VEVLCGRQWKLKNKDVEDTFQRAAAQSRKIEIEVEKKHGK
jgi:hypothetical protein